MGKEARRVAKAERRRQKPKRRETRSPAGSEDDGARLAAAYEREERAGANEQSRRLLADHPPELDDLQAQLVAQLREAGIAQVELAGLFSAEIWKELADEASAFTHEVQRRLDTQGDGGSSRTRKGGPTGFIQRRYTKGVELAPDDPWLRIAISSRLLDVVNAYLGLWTKLTYCDQWYTVPVPAGAERTASQNWHRDHVDRHLVKVFVYLSDVDAGAGPFEYVAGSTGEGPYASLWPWVPGEDHYPPPGELEQRIPSSAIRTLTGPAGTMILCNTSGFHRGGFATESGRILWRYNYSSPASLVLTKRRFRVDLSRFGDLSDAARFALT